MFQAELNKLCQQESGEERKLTAKQINERAAEILMKAKNGTQKLKAVSEH